MEPLTVAWRVHPEAPLLLKRLTVCIRLRPDALRLLVASVLDGAGTLVVEGHTDVVRIHACVVHPQVIVAIPAVVDHRLIKWPYLVPHFLAYEEAGEVGMRVMDWHELPCLLPPVNAHAGDEGATIFDKEACCVGTQFHIVVDDQHAGHMAGVEPVAQRLIPPA